MASERTASDKALDWSQAVGAFGIALCVFAVGMWAFASSISYVGCEISPASERCIAIAKRDDGKLAEMISEHYR
jgi:hypothetical protein